MKQNAIYIQDIHTQGQFQDVIKYLGLFFRFDKGESVLIGNVPCEVIYDIDNYKLYVKQILKNVI